MKIIYWIGHAFFKFASWLYGPYKVFNREKLREDLDGVLIASNHVSFLDPPLVGIGYRKPVYYFARKTLFRNPIANWVLTRWQAIPVDQGNPELSILKKVIALLKAGEKVVLFPEGERSWDGKLKEKGQAGVGMIVAKAKVPVVPVRLFGPEEVLPRGAKWPRRRKMCMVVGDTLDFSELIASGELKGKALYQEIADRIMAAMGELDAPPEFGGEAEA
ncbi:MAG: 1-acyl-sn-glycerol-3-phosphate acyltransferase [Verrucomicrobiales bacterium]|nr:1-acyl-sn-glycerol-3-phosphate acyltransferase [Verrucomicrobiales bacterium]